MVTADVAANNGNNLCLLIEEIKSILSNPHSSLFAQKMFHRRTLDLWKYKLQNNNLVFVKADKGAARVYFSTPALFEERS